jgi:gluconate kinase
MPKPVENETRDQWMERCIPYLIDIEDKEQDEAVAQCAAMWDDKDEE